MDIIKALAPYLSEWIGIIAAAWLLALSPRLKKVPVIFTYAQRDGLIALSIYTVALLFAFIDYRLFPSPLPAAFTLAPAPIHPTTQNLFVAGMCAVVFAMALATRRQPLLSAGWKPALIRPGLEMGAALAILTIFLRNRVVDVLYRFNNDALTALLLALAISLAEESIFRGYIQLRLVSWMGRWQGIFLTAAMFAVWHVPAWIGHAPDLTVLGLVGLTFAQGLVLGWVMDRSGSVAAPAFYRAVSIWMQFFG